MFRTKQWVGLTLKDKGRTLSSQSIRIMLGRWVHITLYISTFFFFNFFFDVRDKKIMHFFRVLIIKSGTISHLSYTNNTNLYPIKKVTLNYVKTHFYHRLILQNPHSPFKIKICSPSLSPPSKSVCETASPLLLNSVF